MLLLEGEVAEHTRRRVKTRIYVILDGSKREVIRATEVPVNAVGPFRTVNGAKALVHFGPRMKGLAHDPKHYDKLGFQSRDVLKDLALLHYGS